MYKNTYSVAQDENRTSTWSATFLPSIAIVLTCLGITLIALGASRGRADLIVLGTIFLLGSILFFALVYTVVCRPFCHRNQVDSFSYIDSNQPDNNNYSQPMSEPPDYSFSQYANEDYKKAKFQPIPRDSVLYGDNISRQFLATPATTKDVNFQEGLETPPPPRVTLPMKVEDKGGTFHPYSGNTVTDYKPPVPSVFKPSTRDEPGPAVYESDLDMDKHKTEMASLELI